MRLVLFLLAASLAPPAVAAVSRDLGLSSKPACEPYVDERELRFRVPTATVSGRVIPGSVQEDPIDAPEAGKQLVFGTAEIVDEADPARHIRINYAYWATIASCGGWEPARGATHRFDLHDDKSKDGTLRVMRFLTEIGARR